MQEKTFKLYQVKSEKTREFGFMGLSMMSDLGVKIDFDNYDLVSEGTTQKREISTNELDTIYDKYNTNIPVGYKGRSMSVSDIVELDGEFYFCDSFGWVRLKKKVTFDIDIIE